MKVEWQAKIDSVDDEKLNLLVSLALSARLHHLLTLSLLRSGVLASRRHRGQVRRVGADVHDARGGQRRQLFLDFEGVPRLFLHPYLQPVVHR